MNPTTEQTINSILIDLEAQADRIVELQHLTSVSNPLMRKVLSLHKALTALQHIASWSDLALEPSALDEPHSTITARETLKAIAALHDH